MDINVLLSLLPSYLIFPSLHIFEVLSCHIQYILIVLYVVVHVFMCGVYSEKGGSCRRCTWVVF